MKKFTVIAIIVAAVFAAIGVAAFFYYKNVFQQVDEKYVIEFVRKYPEKASIRIVRNDTVAVDFHSDRMMPLASTVKIIVAIEFARQAAENKINPQERISLNDLVFYYIPNTDGGAHPAWLKYLKENNIVSDHSASLQQVAKGMMAFSSNANAEYLMDKLGIENINRNPESLELKHHEKIYPFVSALYLFRNNEGLPEDQFYQMMKQMSPNEYVTECFKIHSRLKADTDSTFRRTFVFPSLALQRIWSDRLPRSTATEYASLLKRIDSKSYFPRAVQMYLDSLLEWPMELNPRNKDRFSFIGGKGGSTAFVLTYAMYACDHENNRTEIVTFFDGLALIEGQRLRTALNAFQLNILTKPAFRTTVAETVALLR